MKYKILLSHTKMSKEILMQGNFEIKKNTLYRHKTPVRLRDVDIEKVLVSNKVSFGEKNKSTLLLTYIMIIKLNRYT